MNTSTEHILQCNQSEPLADASGRIVDLINENACGQAGDYIRSGVPQESIILPTSFTIRTLCVHFGNKNGLQPESSLKRYGQQLHIVHIHWCFL